MSVEHRGDPGALTAAEAGELLRLPADVVRALADAGYLRASQLHGGSPRFAAGDLKALQARLSDGPVADNRVGPWGIDLTIEEHLDPTVLLESLGGRSTEVAERFLDLLVAVFPEAGDFQPIQRERFIDEARQRVEAIIALCLRGPKGDEPLEEDLAEIGADAALVGVPLPGLLAALRMTRDLVVQTAVEAAEDRGRHWGLALAVTLTRVLPSIDRLSDAVARGYWEAVLENEAEVLDRYRKVVEQASDGVFEIDGAGTLRSLNPALVELLGRPESELVGRPLDQVLVGVHPGTPEATAQVPRPRDGSDSYQVRQFERLRDGITVGWDGVVIRLA